MNALNGQRRGVFSTLAWLGLGLAVAPGARAGDEIDYNRDILPILSDRCFACHGPDKNQRKADLRLDRRDPAIELEVIVPGKPDESEVVARVESDDPDEVMPPPSMNKPLSAAQKDLLRRWVAAGAGYADHWSYTPIVRPPVPALKEGSKVRNPIDAFIQTALEERKVTPAPEADRRTLVRRLSLDLVGLPPTPEEARAFVEDTSPDAYDTLVKRLLDSPHYGERMATPWLDVVRYADTVGFHGDQNQNAWPYRDWVIDAFNANMPFDRFTVEQLGGDLLPDPTPAQLTATCFNRLTMMTREGGAQPKEYLAKYAADRVRTVGMAWLGSTLACCECHDHKFDPFTARDFYSLAAFFADVKQWGVYSDYGYTPNPDLRGYTNDHPFPPEVVVESKALKTRIDRLKDEIAVAVREADARLDDDPGGKYQGFNRWRNEIAPFFQVNPDGWAVPEPTVNSRPAPPRAPKGKPAAQARQPGFADVNGEGTIIFAEKGATNDTIEIEPVPDALAPTRVAALRLELFPAGEGTSVLRDNATDATLRLSAKVVRKDGKSVPLAFRDAEADHKAPRYRNGFEVIGILDGWKIDGSVCRQNLTGVWLPERPVSFAPGDALQVELPGNLAARVRVSVSPVAPDDLTRGTLPEGLDEWVNVERDEPGSPARAAYLRSTAWDAEAFAKVVALEAKVRECRGGKAPVMVVEAVKPMTVRVLPRGNWQDESGPVVTPAVPAFLPQPEAAASGRRLNRLDLARWLTAPENPLTARVFVNRLWKQFFGAGLSAQVDDLGAQGERPADPELLDWLAAEFRESGWDVKHVVRLIVTSYAYRQDSNPRPEVFERDPDNRWLARQSPRRLDAEFVRDNALSIAGLLNPEAGGPPSFPYQPPGYYANLQFPDRVYQADPGALQYRRGVYTHWQRTFLHPMLAAFDAPSREDCVAARTAANSPQQALTLLNDPEFVEAARVLAARLLGAGAADDASRIALAYDRALCRAPTADESRSLLTLLAAARAGYRARPDDALKVPSAGLAPPPRGADPVELAAWTQVCRVVLNLHETITRY